MVNKKIIFKSGGVPPPSLRVKKINAFFIPDLVIQLGKMAGTA
jgi:hypothetical protein